MNNRMLFSFVLVSSFLLMGADSCDGTPPDVVGTWHTTCQFTNPVGSAEYYWQFSAEGGEEDPMTKFKSWEKLEDGTVKVIDSFYIYQQNTISIKDPEVENNDKLYYVTSTGADTLNFRGGEYNCDLTRASSNPWDQGN